MEFESGDRPLVIKRVKKVVQGHHGGAWKVAFADFATAMMAFFLVLWLMEATSVEEKMAISGYFSDPSAFTEGGSPYVIDLGGGLKDDQTSGESNVEVPDSSIHQKGIVVDEDTVQDLAAQIESRKFQELKKSLETRIQKNPNLKKYKDQIILDVTKDGLQIQIVDAKSRPMFDSGSDVIKPYMNDILSALAETIDGVPNRLSISGHTDALVFTERGDYSNWELSADRANSARRALLNNGLGKKRLAQIVGLADSSLYDKSKPDSPINRRISILVMSEQSEKKWMQQSQTPKNHLESDQSTEFDFKGEQEELNAKAVEQDEFESFDRLRKTMTRKQKKAVQTEISVPKQDNDDELF